MDRDIPSFNRAVMDRIYAKNHQLHLKRLKNIKSGISSHKSYQKSKPSYLPHSNSIVDTNYQIKLPQYNNLKKQVTQQSKNAQIQRQNALLFQKMIKIMKRPDKNNDPSSNRQRQSINVAKQRLSMQYTRINQENRAFYHRLEHQRPTIDNKKLQEQRIKNLNILKFLGKYPNHQARARATQYKTFDLKSRKMNSTSNRVFYNNEAVNNYQQDLDDIDEQNLIKFRNQMIEYDRHMQKLKIQQDKNGLGQNKVNSTMGNFYNNRKKESLSSKYGQVHSNQVSQIQIYEPVIPSRRKFISQGQPRNTGGYQQQKELFNQNQFVFNNKNLQELQPYPYHLNHPSHNIVIEDQNLYMRNKKSIEMNKVPNQSDTKGTNFGKSIIPYQRKLNSKNSQHNILPISEEQKMNNKNNGNEYKSFIRGDENIQSQPIPRFAKNTQSQPIPRFAKNNNKSNSQIDNKMNKIKQQSNHLQNKNVILLYKSVVELKSLLLEQQKKELIKDIMQDLDSENIQMNNINIEIDSRLFDKILSRFNCQITIQRLFDCYKISVHVDTNDRIFMNNKKSNNKQQQISQNMDDISNTINKQLIQKIRDRVMIKLEHVCEVQIPQTQGSLLLQQIDYDYKEFITKMVKIQKDYYQSSHNQHNQYQNNQQQHKEEEEEEESNNYGYRLVIVLNDLQNHTKTQQQQNHKQREQKYNKTKREQQDQLTQINTSKQQIQTINTFKQQTPINTFKQQTPINTFKQQTPINTFKQQTPINTFKQQTPINTSKTIQRNSSSLINTNTINKQQVNYINKQLDQQPIRMINTNNINENKQIQQINNQSIELQTIKQKKQDNNIQKSIDNQLQNNKEQNQQQQQLDCQQQQNHQLQQQQQQQRQQQLQQKQQQGQQQQNSKHLVNQFYIQALDQQLL